MPEALLALFAPLAQQLRQSLCLDFVFPWTLIHEIQNDTTQNLDQGSAHSVEHSVQDVVDEAVKYFVKDTVKVAIEVHVTDVAKYAIEYAIEDAIKHANDVAIKDEVIDTILSSACYFSSTYKQIFC